MPKDDRKPTLDPKDLILEGTAPKPGILYDSTTDFRGGLRLTENNTALGIGPSLDDEPIEPRPQRTYTAEEEAAMSSLVQAAVADARSRFIPAPHPRGDLLSPEARQAIARAVRRQDEIGGRLEPEAGAGRALVPPATAAPQPVARPPVARALVARPPIEEPVQLPFARRRWLRTLLPILGLILAAGVLVFEATRGSHDDAAAPRPSVVEPVPVAVDRGPAVPTRSDPWIAEPVPSSEVSARRVEGPAAPPGLVASQGAEATARAPAPAVRPRVTPVFPAPRIPESHDAPNVSAGPVAPSTPHEMATSLGSTSDHTEFQ